MANDAKTDASAPAPSLKKEFALFLSIPVALILLVAAILVVPGWFAKPKYDFVYSSCPTYSCSDSYSINAAGVISHQKIDQQYGNTQQSQLYYYTVGNGGSRQISLEDSKSYHLDSSNISPDGYSLRHGSSDGGGFLFWGYGSDGSWVLSKGLAKKHITLQHNNDYYNNNISFLGWVTK